MATPVTGADGIKDAVARGNSSVGGWIEWLDGYGIQVGSIHLSLWSAAVFFAVIILVIVVGRLGGKLSRRVMARFTGLDLAQQLLAEKLISILIWALAILIKDDYAKAGVPMLPVVRGERATVIQIAAYTVLTVAISLLPLGLGKGGESTVGWFYVAVAVLLNVELARQAFRLYRQPDRPRAKSLFHYSMIYLALLFLAMAVDRVYWV